MTAVHTYIKQEILVRFLEKFNSSLMWRHVKAVAGIVTNSMLSKMDE